MNKQLIDKIKLQLSSLLSKKEVEVEEVKFQTAVKAGELNIVSDDELVVGSSVYIINEEGVKVELEDGEYVLDSGVKISVEGGKIKSMMDIEEELPDAEIEAEAEEKAEAEMGEEKEDKEEDMEEDVVDEEEEMDEHAKQMVEMFDRLSKLEAMVEDMMSKFTDVKKEKEDLEVKLSELGEVPSEKSIEKKPVEFTSIENKSKKASSEILENIRELAKKRLNR